MQSRLDMTERIQHILEDLRQKFMTQRNLLMEQRDSNKVLLEENLVLKEQFEALLLEKRSLEDTVVVLRDEVEMTRRQIVSTPASLGRNDEQIDELVKEIEYCIGQLKK